MLYLLTICYPIKKMGRYSDADDYTEKNMISNKKIKL